MQQWLLKDGGSCESRRGPPRPMPSIIWQILRGRGVQTQKDVEALFSPKMTSLADPFSLDQMDIAVERLVKARNQGEVVGIYGDFDLDGTPAVALLKRGLELLGFSFIPCYQPRRLREGYGFHPLGVDVLHSQGASLIVTVDVGTTDVKTVDYAKQKAVDVIVTDHHLPKEELPEALAIINPNKGTCPSGLTYFCGTGVAFYMVLALRKRLRELDILSNDFNPKELLDCFAIGTLTDMVPLIRENRVLVKHGLIQLQKTQRPGLHALLQKLGLNGRPISSQSVSMRFAPKLNALSRMDTDTLPLDIFLETNPLKAQNLTSQMLKVNEERARRQKLAERVAEAQMKERKQNGYLWVWSEDFHMGVVGLVANQLAHRYGVPTFVGAVRESGQVVGSSRRPKGHSVNLLDALGAAHGVLDRFGGHAPAAGFELNLEHVESFNQKIGEFYASHGEKAGVLEKTIYFDAKGSLSEINSHFMGWYEGLEPFGMDFEVPIIKFENTVVDQQSILKGEHLKLHIREGQATTMEAIWFFPPKDKLNEDFAGRSVEFLATPQWNHFMGRKRLQLVVEELRLSSNGTNKTNLSVDSWACV